MNATQFSASNEFFGIRRTSSHLEKPLESSQIQSNLRDPSHLRTMISAPSNYRNINQSTTVSPKQKHSTMLRAKLAKPAKLGPLEKLSVPLFQEKNFSGSDYKELGNAKKFPKVRGTWRSQHSKKYRNERQGKIDPLNYLSFNI